MGSVTPGVTRGMPFLKWKKTFWRGTMAWDEGIGCTLLSAKLHLVKLSQHFLHVRNTSSVGMQMHLVPIRRISPSRQEKWRNDQTRVPFNVSC